MQQTLLGGDPEHDDYPRSASHAYASSRGGATNTFNPGTDFSGRLPSNRVSKHASSTSAKRQLRAVD